MLAMRYCLDLDGVQLSDGNLTFCKAQCLALAGCDAISYNQNIRHSYCWAVIGPCTAMQTSYSTWAIYFAPGPTSSPTPSDGALQPTNPPIPTAAPTGIQIAPTPPPNPTPTSPPTGSPTVTETWTMLVGQYCPAVIGVTGTA